MVNPNNQSHVRKGGGAPYPDDPLKDAKNQEERNEARSEGLPGEEPRNVHKAGGGTLGKDLGGAHTGRYGASPGNVVSNRERKPRGQDKDDE